VLFVGALAQPALTQKSGTGPTRKRGPVGPTRQELAALKKQPFYAALTSKQAVYEIGEYIDLALQIKNVRTRKLEVVVPEISYHAVRFEMAYGKRKPFIYGRYINNDQDPQKARFDRLPTGRSEKARFRIPAILRGLVRITALYPDAEGETHRSNTIEVEVRGSGPLKVKIEVAGRGKVVLGFFPDQAPNTVAHFIDRVKQSFYDELVFHRVVPGFVAQTGCPFGSGTGGPDYTVKGEFTGPQKHVRGALGMARNSGRNDSNGSQFYICLTTEKCAGLNGQYTVFGRVEAGMDVVDRIKKGDRMNVVGIVKARKGKKQKGKTKRKRKKDT
jgi:peptidyl-prolyl cis-trans isomerase B (cyclophilin B)